MAKITRLNADQRENLIAYLDGELDEQQSQEIEQVLTESPVARHEVEMLARTWDLLGVLPNAKATEEFSRKTLSTIHAAEHAGSPFEFARLAQTARRIAILAVGTTILALFGYVGFVAAHRWMPSETESLIDDYDVIANLDDYLEVGDIEFLKTLQAKRTFADYHEPADK